MKLFLILIGVIFLYLYIVIMSDKSNESRCKYGYEIRNDGILRGYTNDNSGKRCVKTTHGKICGEYIIYKTEKGTTFCKPKK